jgi:hypothetical protein
VNIAFQALLLILFYLPGTLFIASLFGSLSKDQELPIISLSMTGRTAAALLCAGAFHAIWYAAINGLGKLGIDIASTAGQFFVLLSVSQQSQTYLRADTWESGHLGGLFWYFATICSGATLAGALLHAAIAHFKLDYKFAWLRFNPQWHYFLSGEYAEDPESVVWIDALSVFDDEAVVYSGLVKEYWFDEKTGALDTIWLEWAERLCIHVCPDEPGTGTGNRAVQIPGARFALKMSEIRNINIVYLSPASDAASSDGTETSRITKTAEYTATRTGDPARERESYRTTK